MDMPIAKDASDDVGIRNHIEIKIGTDANIDIDTDTSTGTDALHSAAHVLLFLSLSLSLSLSLFCAASAVRGLRSHPLCVGVGWVWKNF